MDEPNALSVWKCTITIRRASMLRNPGKSTEEIQLGGGEAGAASGLAAAADNTWHWLANKEETNSSSVSTSFLDFNKTFTDTNLLTPSPPSCLNLTIVQSSLQMMASLFSPPSSLSSCGLDHYRLHCNSHLHHQCHHTFIHHRWSPCDCKKRKWWQRKYRWVESTGCLSGAQFAPFATNISNFYTKEDSFLWYFQSCQRELDTLFFKKMSL